MGKAPTISQIARKTGLSSASVSMILSGRNVNRFAPETVSKVYAASRSLGYRSRAEREGNRIVVIVCPSVINPYYATLLQGMELEASKCGYRTMIFNTYWSVEREQKIIAFANNPTVQGVIFAMPPLLPRSAEELAEKLPLVMVGDREDNECAIDAVEMNNFAAGRQMGDYLASLGHRHICYITTPLNKQHSSRVLRLRGLEESFRGRGIVETLVTDITPQEEIATIMIEHEVGTRMTEICLSRHPDVTAIVAINDMVAFGVLDKLKERGIRVPRDVSVAGFDNIYPSHFRGVDLTTIDHFINERGQRAFSLLRQKLESAPKDNCITKVEYRNALIIRSTTGPARPRTNPGLAEKDTMR